MFSVFSQNKVGKATKKKDKNKKRKEKIKKQKKKVMLCQCGILKGHLWYETVDCYIKAKQALT